MNFYEAYFIVKDKDGINGLATEHYKNISLSDFEVIYGNEIREIESIALVITETITE